MASITIRRIDERMKQRLRMRAARNGHSMEAEVRAILSEVVEREDPNKPAALEGIQKARGSWKGRSSTDEVMRLTRES